MTFQPPRKRKRQRMTEHPSKGREWPTHRAFVRKHECVVPGCDNQDIQACHARDDLPAGESGGMGQKPGDWWTWPGCSAHHAEQHRIGERAFDAKYAVDIRTAAKWLADNTTDKNMREFLKERG